MGEHEELLDSLSENYNLQWVPKISSQVTEIKNIRWPSAREEWQHIKDTIKKCNEVISGYGESKLTSGTRQCKELQYLMQTLKTLEDSIYKDAQKYLEYENLENGKNFFEDYPLVVSLKDTLIEKLKKRHTGNKNIESLFNIAKTYTKQIKSDFEVKEEIIAEVEELLQLEAKEESICNILKLYNTTKALSVSPRNIPIKVAIHKPDSNNTFFPIDIKIDLPFEWKEIKNLNEGKDCQYIIFVGLTNATLNRTVGNYLSVSSHFLAGYNTINNPDYQRAIVNMQNAQQLMANARAQQIAASNDVICNAYGCYQNPYSQMAANVLMIAAVKKHNEAQQLLNSIPPTIQVPVYEPYTYETALISSEKKVGFMAFIGNFSLAKDLYAMDYDSYSNFSLAYNVNTKDQEINSLSLRYANEERVDSWEKGTASINLSNLIADAKRHDINSSWDQVSSIFNKFNICTNITQPGQLNNTGNGTIQNDNMFSSVVIIKTANSLGAGFYISPNFVLTNAHVTEGQTYIKMRTFFGQEISGKVSVIDKRRDFALINTMETGLPVNFCRKEVSIGTPVEVVGHPQGLIFSLTKGIVSQLRTLPPVSGIGGGLVSYIQLDASISPGNSGGPVFQNGEVIGMATWKLVGDATENLNFAVHRDEVMSFLRENGFPY